MGINLSTNPAAPPTGGVARSPKNKSGFNLLNLQIPLSPLSSRCFMKITYQRFLREPKIKFSWKIDVIPYLFDETWIKRMQRRKTKTLVNLLDSYNDFFTWVCQNGYLDCTCSNCTHKEYCDRIKFSQIFVNHELNRRKYDRLRNNTDLSKFIGDD